MLRSKTSLLLILALLATLTLGCGLLDGLTKKVTEEGAEIVNQGKATLEAVATQVVPTEEPSGEASGGAASAPTSAPAAKPTQAPKPTAAPEEQVADLSNVADFEALDSYRMTITMTWKEVRADGTTEEGTMEVLNEYDRASESQRVVISGLWPDDEGVGMGEAGEMEMIQIGTSSYIGSDGEWMAIQSEETGAEQMDWVSDPDEFGGGEGKYVGTEKVNGVSAKHYHYAESGIGNMGMGFGDVDKAESDVWVSEEHNVVVKAVITYEGKDEEDTEWSGDMRLDVTDINEPIVIEAPEGVEPPGMPEDVPLMEGATNVQSMMGINTFEIEATADEVTAFYDEEMPANGWESSDDGIPVMRTYTKDGSQAMLMIEETETGCSVSLMISEE